MTHRANETLGPWRLACRQANLLSSPFRSILDGSLRAYLAQHSTLLACVQTDRKTHSVVQDRSKRAHAGFSIRRTPCGFSSTRTYSSSGRTTSSVPAPKSVACLRELPIRTLVRPLRSSLMLAKLGRVPLVLLFRLGKATRRLSVQG